MVLGFDGKQNFENFYKTHTRADLCSALAPAFNSTPAPLKAAKIAATTQKNLHILAGHIDLARYEAQFAVAFATSNTLPVMRSLPGAAAHLLRITAAQNDIDIVLIDMSPSIGALNQSLFLASDFFIVPTSPDYFCLLAVQSLASVLPDWNSSGVALRVVDSGLSYPLPAEAPKFMGIISQRYRPRSGAPAASFQEWIDRIKEVVISKLVPAFSKQQMTISKKRFESSGAQDSPCNLANIADFNSLIAQSHKHNVPVFALTDKQIQRVGYVLKTMRTSRNRFRKSFAELAKTVTRLTSSDSASAI